MKPIKTTTQRGYGNTHQKQRAQLLHNHKDGAECQYCAQPMYRDPARNFDHAPLEADHENGDKTRPANRLIHRRCNRQIANHWQKHGPGWHTKHQPQPNTINWPGGRKLTWQTT